MRTTTFNMAVGTAALAAALVAASSASPFSHALAQAPRTPEIALSVGGLTLSANDITRRIDALKSDASMPPKVREEAVSSYSAALDFLRNADNWNFKANKHKRLVAEAAGHLQRLQVSARAPVVAPSPKAGSGLSALEQPAQELRSLVADKQAELDEITAEQQRRAQRRLEIPARRAEIRRQMSAIRASMSGADGVTDNGEPSRAALVRAVAEERSLDLEAEAIDAELAGYDARRELLRLRRDVLSKEIAVLYGTQEALQSLIDDKRLADADKDAAAASDAAEKVTHDVHAVLRAAAEENARLAAARSGPDGIIARLERARTFSARVDVKTDALSRDLQTVQDRAKIIGFSGPIGALLRKQKKELPDKAFHRQKLRARQDEIADVQLRLIELEDERVALADPESTARAVVSAQDPPLDQVLADTVTARLATLLEAKRGYLDSLIEDYDAYFLALIDLDAKQRALLDETTEFSRYIDEHVLWIRSTTPLDWTTFRHAATALVWLVHPDKGREIVEEWRLVLRRTPLSLMLALLVLAFVVAIRPRARAHLRGLLAQPAPSRRGMLVPLGGSLLATAVLSIQWPALLYLLGWLLKEAARDHARAVSAGLQAIAWFYFMLEFARQVFRRCGLAVEFFNWPAPAAESVRRYLTSAMIVALPAAFLVRSMNSQPNDVWQESLGRLSFVVTSLTIGALSYGLLRRDGPVLQAITSSQKAYSWLYRARAFIGPLAFGTCAFLSIFAVLGYYFAALSIGPLVSRTLEFGLVLAFVQAMVLQSIGTARSRVKSGDGSEQAADPLTSAASMAAEIGQGKGDAVESPSVVSDQERRVVGNATAFVFVIGSFFIWQEFLPALNAFSNTTLWRVSEQQAYEIQTESGVESRTGLREVPITVGSAIKAVLILVVTLSAARHLPGFLGLGLRRRLKLDAGVTNAVTTMSRYLLVLLGVIGGAGTLGLAWNQVQWLAAAVTVGLGFGLQEIFANFVSGIILLFERPIRIGDTVTLGDITGTVSRIQSRATTIVDWDRKELIVPNKEFITGQLINWTLSDTILRLTVPVGIAYGSDTKLAEKILLETARKNPNALDDPPPNVVFGGFGDNSLNFEIRVFIPHIEYLVRTRHQLHMQIDEAFRAAGIEIAFPQRDLHIRSVAAPVAVRIER